MCHSFMRFLARNIEALIGPRKSFKYCMCFGSPLACCGMTTTLIFEIVPLVAWLMDVGLKVASRSLTSRRLMGLAPRRPAEEVGSGPEKGFKYYVSFWSPLVCCGMKTALIIETARLAAWLTETSLWKMVWRSSASLRLVGPEEVRQGGWEWSFSEVRSVVA